MLFDPTQIPSVIPEDQKENARAWIKNVIEAELWTGAMVCERYKISQPLLSRMVSKDNPAFVIRMGNTLCFVMHFAKPWLQNIVDTQHARVSTGEATRQPSKRGRPKDVWRNYEVDGVKYRLEDKYEDGLAYWRDYHLKEFNKFLSSPAADDVQARMVPKAWLDKWKEILSEVYKPKRDRKKKK